MIKAVFFDFFGVLHPDTLWGLADVFIPDRTAEQKQTLRNLVRRSDLGMITREEFWSSAAELFGTTMQSLMYEKEKLGSLNPLLMDSIKVLKRAGIKTGIISNVGTGFLEAAFKDYDVDEYFDELILSSTYGFIKPDPRIYKIAAESVSVGPSECFFFDDSMTNVEGARAVGMHAEHFDGVRSCIGALKASGVGP